MGTLPRFKRQEAAFALPLTYPYIVHTAQFNKQSNSGCAAATLDCIITAERTDFTASTSSQHGQRQPGAHVNDSGWRAAA